MTNATRLRELMQQHQLTRPALAEITGYSVPTIKSWLLPESSPCHRPLSDRTLRAIEAELSR